MCRRWQEVASAPWLWTRWPLKIRHCSTTPQLARVASALSLPRLATLARLTVPRVTGDLSPLLTAMASHPGLIRVTFHAYLAHLEPGLLARAVTRCSKVAMVNTQLTGQQVEAILEAVEQEGSRLHVLDLSSNDLHGVEAGLLARTVNLLEVALLGGCNLGVEQVTAVLERAGRGTRLEYLDLRGNPGVEGQQEEVVVRAKGAVKSRTRPKKASTLEL